MTPTLARLDSKQQALIFGHVLPMPVVVGTREYGAAESYAQLGPPQADWPGRPSRQGIETPEQRLAREIAELF